MKFFFLRNYARFCYFLSKTYVTHNGSVFDDFVPSSGVHQVYNLEHLQFGLYVNDLLVKIDCPIPGYGDDIKIISEIIYAAAEDEEVHCKSLLNPITSTSCISSNT